MVTTMWYSNQSLRGFSCESEYMHWHPFCAGKSAQVRANCSADLWQPHARLLAPPVSTLALLRQYTSWNKTLTFA